jgi:hypothetical protein
MIEDIAIYGFLATFVGQAESSSRKNPQGGILLNVPTTRDWCCGA